MSAPSRAAVVGVGESDLGITSKSSIELLVQAAQGAAEDAGITLGEIDGLAVTGIAQYSAAQVSEYLGLQPNWTNSSFSGGSSWEQYLGDAAEAVAGGRANAVLLAYGSNQRSARSRTLAPAPDRTTHQGRWEAPHRPLYPVSLYAMAATRYLHEYGVEMAELAEVAVAAREWAILNPRAFRYEAGSLSAADVLASPLVSSPLRSLDCCLVTDGGGAVIVTTLERARSLRRRPVVVLGHGDATTSVTMAGVPDLLHTGAVVSGKRAFERAGLEPGDVDVAEIYDSFTITVLLSLEALGFCGFGEAAEFVRDRGIRPGGAFPMNTSGGGLSYCHPGMFGIFLIIEAVRQLRGECGPRQVAGAEVALVHGTGGILSTHSTVLLAVDR